ncbi:hypothetical protein IFM47457_06386 [Aspergillus lentulus]|nr:hypothetical protein IFM47457_06386 [Aspergillus lentulus]
MITLLRIIRTAMVTASMMIPIVVPVMGQAVYESIWGEAGGQRHQGKGGEQLDEVHFGSG